MEIKMENKDKENNNFTMKDGLMVFDTFKTMQQMNEMIQSGQIKVDNNKNQSNNIPPNQFYKQPVSSQPSSQNNQVNNYMNQNNPKLVYDKRLFTKYEITPQTYFYVKFGLKWLNDEDNEQSDRLIITQYNKADKSIQCHWLKFRMWTFEQSNNWKSQCTQLDQYKNFVFNKNKLFRTKIRNLLIDWSFKEKQPDMRLMHVNGILADQSIKLFMNLHPNILFFVQDRLRDILQSNM